MPVTVKLKFTKGGLKDKEFCYDEKECVIIGRLDPQGLDDSNENRNIKIPDSDTTVSRYHCMLDITPPTVKVRDFGSLNGTFLNGEIIGRREASLSVEEARKQQYNEFTMKTGDRLGLSKNCEIVLDVAIPEYCADCHAEIDRPKYSNADQQPVCHDCHAKAETQRKKEEAARLALEKAAQERREAEKRARELAAKEQAAKEQDAIDKAARERKEAERQVAQKREQEKQEEERRKRLEAEQRAEIDRLAAEKAKRNNPKCEICGATISANGPAICESCRKDPVKILKHIVLMAAKGVDDAGQVAGYKNIRLLGKGGMGAVWLVEETKTGKQMAMKLMLPDAAADEKGVKLFLREASLGCQLSHKNIVSHYKSGRSGNVYFILMEYCAGGSVDNLMKKYGGKLSIDTAKHITFQILDGLEYAHNAPIVSTLAAGNTKSTTGVVHRDFKPGNIFLSDTSSRPVAKVADFGLAKAFQTAGLTNDTVTGQAAGTPMFMPRQQIINYRYAKQDVDVWAAAASFYNMLTGEVPKNFTGKDVFAIALYGDTVPIRKRDSSIPKGLAEVIDTALREKPGIGFKTAYDFKKALERVI